MQSSTQNREIKNGSVRGSNPHKESFFNKGTPPKQGVTAGENGNEIREGNTMHCLLCKHGAGEITECEPIQGYAVCEICAHDECLFDEPEYSAKGWMKMEWAERMEAKEAALVSTGQALSSALSTALGASS